MIRGCSSFVLLAGLSLSLAAQAIAPPPPPPPVAQDGPVETASPGPPAHFSGTGSFSISGTVVSATTGTPLDRAEVTLFTAGPGSGGASVAETVTGENGAFRFDHLQAGTYRLEAFRRGYIAGGYQEHEGFYTGIVTGANLVSTNLRVELLPTAVIGGTITDDSGEPVAGAQVRLFRQDHSSGEERIINAQTDMTDDTGTYEFARVRAGTFYISVAAQPWYAFHPRPKTDDSGNLLPADEQPRSPLDVAYSTTFYENGTDSDSATPIQVNAGDHVEADLSLHAVPAIHIQIRLQPPTEGRGMSIPQLMQNVFGSDQYQPSNQFTIGTKGGGMVADLSGIAPGHYVLRQFGQSGERSRTTDLELTSDLTVDPATSLTAAGVEVSGKIAMASGGKLPNRTRVTLIPTDGSEGREGELLAEDGTFTLRSVAPGRYEVEAESPETRLAVSQMMASGAEVSGNHITIANQSVTMAATLARGTTTINGFAKLRGQGVGGAMVFLIPKDPGAGHDLYRRAQTNTDGSFTLNRVIPGDYTVVAVESGWTLNWAKPGVMGPYLARGVRVRVTSQRELQLPTAVEVQPR